MSRDKQIEEMRKDLCEADEAFCKFCRGRRCQECEYYFARTDCKNQILAEKLTDKGYRKSTDVAREIFEDLQGLLVMRIGVNQAIAELKKKYTEGGE